MRSAPLALCACVLRQADLVKGNAGGTTPAHICCVASQHECLAILLAGGAPLEPRLTTGARHTPLSLACAHDQPKCVELLLHAKAAVTTPNGVGALPLHVACEHHAPSCVKLLFGAGAAVELPTKLADGVTTITSPLYTAARRGHDDCVKLCLAAKADVHAQSGEFGASLYGAICAASPSTVRLLLRAHADPQHDGGGPTQSGRRPSPLYAACHPTVHKEAGPDKAHGLVECAKVLLEAGANANATDDSGRTPLHVAARAGSVALVRELLASNANPHAQTAAGETAERLAMERVSHSDHAPAYAAIVRMLQAA